MVETIWSIENTLWVIMGLIGGLGLFLLGMQMLSQSMKKLAGKQMRHFLGQVSKNKMLGAIFGVFFTILFQSSSASTVVLVGFVDAGLLKFLETLPVVLGTAVGTTITAQLVAFKIGEFALLALGSGFILSMASKGSWKYFFEAITSLGLIFYGMELMSQSIVPFKSYPPFINLMVSISNPGVALCIGLIATALIQSSAAFIGILISLGTTGLIDPMACLPMILGANIGTTVTAIMSAITAGRQAKKVALANTFFKFSTALLFIFLIPEWDLLSTWISGGKNYDFGRYLANAHTLFNVILLLLWLPVTHLAAKIIDKIMPDKEEGLQLQYLTDESLETPSLSIHLLKKELVRMGQLVVQMVDMSIHLFVSDKYDETVEKIHEMEKETDLYREKINRFWIRSAHMGSHENWPDELYQLLHLVNEFEQIADIVSVNIISQSEKWQSQDCDFSEEGKDELLYYHSRCVRQLERAISLIEKRDYNRALRMKQKYRKYAYLAFDLELSHYKRLFSPQSQSIESSKVHLELLNLFMIINSRATNFGRLILMDSDHSEVINQK